MKIKTSVFLALISVVLFQTALAGSVSNGKIYYYMAQNGNLFFFKTTVAETGKPSCNSQSRFAVNTATQSGKDIMNAVINAKNANLSVNVVGTGTCTIYPNSENASYVTVFGTSAMIGPRGLAGPMGAIGPRGLTGATGPRGLQGPQGSPVHSVATCSSASVYGGLIKKGISGNCSCSGRTISKVTSISTCSATSDTGRCSATGVTIESDTWEGACCVCGA